VLTVCATVVLLALGSAVTNFKAGMADPVWPTSPAALLDSSPEQLGDVRWVIEHSHRLAGYIVGCCAIVLAAWLWRREPRRWLCWLGTVALLGVCVQGLFGGLRVTEHARWGLHFRIIHGSFAPVVLGLLVGVMALTSPSWAAPLTGSPDEIKRLRRGSLHVLGAVYVQIVLGVVLRHTYDPLAQRAHLLVAFAVALGVVWLVRLAWGRDRSLRIAALALASLLGVQIVLGVEAWMTQLGQGMLPEMLPVTAYRVVVRTAHVLGGSLLLAATVVVMVQARRKPAGALALTPAEALEGAA
jgi:cytochrome c oxidase assembly protein subunit 15